MTAEQAKIVGDTWQKISSESQLFARKFYQELFGRFPHLRHLFANDLGEQEKKFTAMIDMIVQYLQTGRDLDAELFALGKRHVEYGVEARDYAPVGEALDATLQRCLGAAFDAEVRGAWIFAYEMIAKQMLRGAER
jgi:hemoglobin-like flavoprotein